MGPGSHFVYQHTITLPLRLLQYGPSLASPDPTLKPSTGKMLTYLTIYLHTIHVTYKKSPNDKFRVNSDRASCGLSACWSSRVKVPAHWYVPREISSYSPYLIESDKVHHKPMTTFCQNHATDLVLKHVSYSHSLIIHKRNHITFYNKCSRW